MRPSPSARSSRVPPAAAASVEYFKNEEASRAKTAGGWLRSGDMGHRDAEGWFFFDYRKGGGIRHDGEFVQPDKVEKVIAEQPGVSDVFVYGVPAASGAPGEKDVVAAIVPANAASFDPATIFDACRRALDPERRCRSTCKSWTRFRRRLPRSRRSASCSIASNPAHRESTPGRPPRAERERRGGESMTLREDPPAPTAISRRAFLELGGGLGLSLVLLQFTGLAARAVAAEDRGEQELPRYDSWEDVYRNEWRWDRVTWGSHTNQCFPGGCSFHVQSRDGVVWREEQSATTEACSPDYPDFNPQGCQKGCGFHHALVSPDRVLHPLRRVGARGEGRWQRIPWDEALTRVADAILDAHQSAGPQSFVVDAPHIHAGSVALSGIHRLAYMLGGLVTDLNVAIGDDLKGILHTFGTMQLGYSADNFFDAELIVLTNSNLSATGTPIYHFLTEARYNGSEIVLLAPDYNPTALTADIHVPLRTGTDAALWLGVCQVILAESLLDAGFVREQTDLALLVRSDTGRYLRAQDVDGGREDQLYFFDEATQRIAPAPRGTLRFDGSPALAGSHRATLADGREVEVKPVLALLREKLDRESTPEQAAAACGVGAELIRGLARKIARKRTCCYIGFTSAKQFHGDLHERSLLLAMALTGNWGKSGTGFNCFLVPIEHVGLLMTLERPAARGGLLGMLVEHEKVKLEMWLADREVTEELVTAELMSRQTKRLGIVPPVFWFYHHAGYAKLWDRPGMARPEREAELRRVPARIGRARLVGRAAGASRSGAEAEGADADGAQPAAARAQRAQPLRRGTLPEARHDLRRRAAHVVVGGLRRHRAAGGVVLREGRHDDHLRHESLHGADRAGRGAARRGEAGVGDLRGAGAEAPRARAGARPRDLRRRGGRASAPTTNSAIASR